MIVSTINGGDAASAEEPQGGGKKKKLIIVAVALLLVAGAAYWFLLRPTGPVEPVPGEVLTMEPIQVNLAGGHYLKVGIALQLTADAHEADGSKALDATIATFSGKDMADIGLAEERAKLKHELEEKLHEGYHGDVMEVYFTEFVTQ